MRNFENKAIGTSDLFAGDNTSIFGNKCESWNPNLCCQKETEPEHFNEDSFDRRETALKTATTSISQPIDLK